MKILVTAIFAASTFVPALHANLPSSTLSKVSIADQLQEVFHVKPGADSKCADPRAIIYPFCFKLR